MFPHVSVDYAYDRSAPMAPKRVLGVESQRRAAFRFPPFLPESSHLTMEITGALGRTIDVPLEGRRIMQPSLCVCGRVASINQFFTPLW